VVVVLDNLHEVPSPQVHAGLLRFVERPLPMLSLLATTRRDPPWPLPRLRLAGPANSRIATRYPRAAASTAARRSSAANPRSRPAISTLAASRLTSRVLGRGRRLRDGLGAEGAG
jgi:hypothetical protein